jgi:hypothetical protein
MDLIIVCTSVNKEHHNDNDHSLQHFISLPKPPDLTSSNTMAGAMFVEALGLIGTTLGIVQFGMDNFQEDPKGTIVSIKAGDGIGASNTLVSIQSIDNLWTCSPLTRSNRVARFRRYTPTTPRMCRSEQLASRPWLATVII